MARRWRTELHLLKCSTPAPILFLPSLLVADELDMPVKFIVLTRSPSNYSRPCLCLALAQHPSLITLPLAATVDRVHIFRRGSAAMAVSRSPAQFTHLDPPPSN